MGRKAKGINSLGRRQAYKDPYDKVLIVCEGEKTEPKYFERIVNYYLLSTANVVVTGECGSDPVSVVDYAIRNIKEEEKFGIPFDAVYCVIDRDLHPNISAARNKLGSNKYANIMNLIESVPCFEFWFLLHFKKTTNPYIGGGGRSGADRVISDLKEYLPDYQKGRNDIFDQTFDKLEMAKDRARQVEREVTDAGADNPKTNAYELVAKLQNLKE